MQKYSDKGGNSVYMTSMVDQTQLNTGVHFVYKTVNEEICKLAKTSGKIDPTKVFIGGES
jgi:hypothetical protein